MSSRALKALEAYVQALNAGAADDIAALFGEGARVCHPSGTHDSPEAIHAFFTNTILTNESDFTIGRAMTDGNAVMAELRANTAGDRRVHLVAVLVVDDEDRIRDLAIYSR